MKVSRSLVTGNGFPPSRKIKAKICVHKFAGINVTQKKRKKKKKNGRQTLTHAAMHMSNKDCQT